jgi:hypothetical protein
MRVSLSPKLGAFGGLHYRKASGPGSITLAPGLRFPAGSGENVRSPKVEVCAECHGRKTVSCSQCAGGFIT